MMEKINYGIIKNMGTGDFDKVLNDITEALKKEGFGVLMDIDVQSVLKQKIGAEMSKYRILGVCNPSLAKGALEMEPLIGLLLPCNVVIMEDKNRDIVVAAADPKEMFKIVGNHELTKTADSAAEKINRAINSL